MVFIIKIMSHIFATKSAVKSLSPVGCIYNVNDQKCQKSKKVFANNFSFVNFSSSIYFTWRTWRWNSFKYVFWITGAAWCMKYNRSRNKLAIGTEEGFVCIFDVTSDGLSFDKILDKQEGRVLSLDWHHDGFHIVTGSTGQRMFLLLFTYIPTSVINMFLLY